MSDDPTSETVPWHIPAVLLVRNEIQLEDTFERAVRAFEKLAPADREDAEIRFALNRNQGSIDAASIAKYAALLSGAR